MFVEGDPPVLMVTVPEMSLPLIETVPPPPTPVPLEMPGKPPPVSMCLVKTALPVNCILSDEIEVAERVPPTARLPAMSAPCWIVKLCWTLKPPKIAKLLEILTSSKLLWPATVMPGRLSAPPTLIAPATSKLSLINTLPSKMALAAMNEPRGF